MRLFWYNSFKTLLDFMCYPRIESQFILKLNELNQVKVNIMTIDMTGPAIIVALSTLGSAIGCAIAWMAAHIHMSQTKNGHEKLILLSITPVLQTFLGILLMILMKTAIISGTLSPDAATKIGFFSGISLLGSAVVQGMCIKTMMIAIEKQPFIFGKAFLAIATIQSFAVFTFVFTFAIL